MRDDRNANTDPTNGVRYGVIAVNEISGDSHDNLINCGDDIGYLSAVAEKKAEIKAALESALSTIDGMDDIDTESLAESVYDEGFPNGLENVESSQYRYDHDGVIAETNDRNYIVVIKSPYYTFVRQCSPCYPNAGDLSSPNEHGVKTYCFNEDWFDDYNKCPYPVYRLDNDELVYSPPEDE